MEVGDKVYIGRYEQDKYLPNIKEPIDWRVLEIEDDTALLLSERILDCGPYNEAYTGVTWESCSMRAWLNTAFYQTAFDAEEQAKILAATVVNDDNPVWGTKGGNTTEDKVFLLSFNEVMTRAYGFSSNYYAYDSRRMAQGTDYAITRGLWVCENDEHAGNGNWWLRSPGGSQNHARTVGYDGYVRSACNADNASVGIRPAIRMRVGRARNGWG